MSTHVVASAACVAALTTDERLEAMQVPPEQTVTFGTDTINPPGEGSWDDHEP